MKVKSQSTFSIKNTGCLKFLRQTRYNKPKWRRKPVCCSTYVSWQSLWLGRSRPVRGWRWRWPRKRSQERAAIGREWSRSSPRTRTPAHLYTEDWDHVLVHSCFLALFRHCWLHLSYFPLLNILFQDISSLWNRRWQTVHPSVRFIRQWFVTFYCLFEGHVNP